MGDSMSSSMSKYKYKDLTKYIMRNFNIELDQRSINPCMSSGDPNLWIDIRAINNKVSEEFFFALKDENIIKESTKSKTHRYTTERYIIVDDANLT